MTDELVNISSHLSAMAEIKPHFMAVVMPYKRDFHGKFAYIHYTLKQLNEESDKIAFGLEEIGVKRGTRTVLMVSPSPDFFALTFALFKVGAVPVMIDPGIGIKNLGKCIEEAEPLAFIGIPKAHWGRTIMGWGKKTLKILITVGNKMFWGGYTLEELVQKGMKKSQKKPYPIAKTQKNETAAILFTSGSTGISKGAVYTHGIFDQQVKYLKEIYGIQPGEIDLATFPLFALFGPALGMTAVIPDMDATRPAQADPSKIIQAIEDFGATEMFGSPALINRVGRYGEKHGIKLPSLKRVISAGAPANPDSIERFSKMLREDVQIFTPYGATESLPVSSIGSHEILKETRYKTAQGKGACVGLPVRGIDLKIIKISDEPIESWSEELVLPMGEIGEIAVKGSIVTGEYYNRPQSTHLAKISDPQNGGFYHRMGDVGYLDEKGRIWFCGRKSHRVVTPEQTFFTIPCEAIFNAHEQVFRTALVGVKIGDRVEPVICIELEKEFQSLVRDNKEEKKKIIKELLDLGIKYPHTSPIKRFLFHPSFPVDIRHNAKIFREKLRVWAEREIKKKL